MRVPRGWRTFWVSLALFACRGDPKRGPDRQLSATGRSVIHLERISEIGSEGGAGASTFGRVADVRLGPEDDIYVLDAEKDEVLVFTLEGRYLRTIGKRGQGPDEFLRPYSIAFDSVGRLWVGDAGSGKYSVFDRDGRLAGVRSGLRCGGVVPGGLEYIYGSLHDFCDILVAHQGSIRSLGFAGVVMPGGETQMAPDTILLGPWQPQGIVVAGQRDRMTFVSPLAARRLLAWGASGHVYEGVTNRYDITEIGPGGDTVRSISRRLTATRLSRGDEASVLRWADAIARRTGTVVERSSLPKDYPLFDAIVPDDDHYLWVLRGEPMNANGFDVFDPEGSFIGSVAAPTMPDRRLGPPLHVRRGYLMGVGVDSLGVQYVEIFRVVRQEEGGS